MSRHDESLLRIYLSAMPLGKYHSKDAEPGVLFRDGEEVALVITRVPGGRTGDAAKGDSGLVASLVHLLNTREQTEIGK